VSYQPIDDHGIIGNLRTAALIGKNGSIDWLCFPRFDSPSVFGALLDDRKGGYFRIYPTVEIVTHKQLYWPDTNILVTRFLSDDGVGEVTDFMPIGEDVDGRINTRLIRRVKVLRGTMRFSIECHPAFNYARDTHVTRIVSGGAQFSAPGLRLGLKSPIRLRHSAAGVCAEFSLSEGKARSFELYEVDDRGHRHERGFTESESERLFVDTVTYWRRWLSKNKYRGRWREIVNRSALVLKLLTYEPTGAIVAAPTCSLPETLGGSRNWDYRYTWLRDAAFTIYSLMRLGYTEEAMRFAGFLDARCHDGVQGRALGNFPQALTHLSLISAAFNLDRYLDNA
jgi:GH15 family glucan-1,4-alpha-glucosidase